LVKKMAIDASGGLRKDLFSRKVCKILRGDWIRVSRGRLDHPSWVGLDSQSHDLNNRSKREYMRLDLRRA